MMKKKKTIFVWGLVAVFTVAITVVLVKFPPSFLARYFTGLRTPPLTAGMTAPKFELESLTGETVSLEQFKGKAVVIKFWSIY